MHLRPAVRRLTVSWIVAVVIVATMTVSMAYDARQVVGACWLAVAVLFVYALAVLRRLRPYNGRRAPAGGVDSTEVREWAKAQGIDVKDRGRVPAELVVKFKAAEMIEAVVPLGPPGELLITGQPPELGDQLAQPALDWLHARGWQLHPQPLCPADHR